MDLTPEVCQQLEMIVLRILRGGLLMVRSSSFSRMVEECQCESRHIRTLPDLLRSPSIEGFRQYYSHDRIEFMKQAASPDYFAADWEEMRVVLLKAKTLSESHFWRRLLVNEGMSSTKRDDDAITALLFEILSIGVRRIQESSQSGDMDACGKEADRLHNIPGTILYKNVEMLNALANGGIQRSSPGVERIPLWKKVKALFRGNKIWNPSQSRSL